MGKEGGVTTGVEEEEEMEEVDSDEWEEYEDDPIPVTGHVTCFQNILSVFFPLFRICVQPSKSIQIRIQIQPKKSIRIRIQAFS